MNWVGGIRDCSKRNKLLHRQKEFFEKKRIGKYNKQRQKQRKTKGVSRDLLNLECVSKTIRNPFDDSESDLNSSKISNKFTKKGKSDISGYFSSSFSNDSKNAFVHKQVNMPGKYEPDYGPSKIDFASEEIDMVSQPSLKKHPVGILKPDLPSYQSTPIAAKPSTRTISDRYQIEELVAQGRQDERCLEVKLPSPIATQESFSIENMSGRPISIQTDEERLIQHSYAASCDVQSQPLASPNSFFSSNTNMDRNLISCLHGVTTEHKFNLMDNTHAYDMSPQCFPGLYFNNHIAPLSSPTITSQQKGQLYLNNYPDRLPKVPRVQAPSSVLSFSPVGREVTFENEDVFVNCGSSSTFAMERIHDQLLSGNSPISLNNSTFTIPPPSSPDIRTEETSLNRLVLNQVPVSRFTDAAQQTDVDFRQGTLRTCEASTSPVRWTATHVAVQTEAEDMTSE